MRAGNANTAPKRTIVVPQSSEVGTLSCVKPPHSAPGHALHAPLQWGLMLHESACMWHDHKCMTLHRACILS